MHNNKSMGLNRISIICLVSSLQPLVKLFCLDLAEEVATYRSERVVLPGLFAAEYFPSTQCMYNFLHVFRLGSVCVCTRPPLHTGRIIKVCHNL